MVGMTYLRTLTLALVLLLVGGGVLASPAGHAEDRVAVNPAASLVSVRTVVRTSVEPIRGVKISMISEASGTGFAVGLSRIWTGRHVLDLKLAENQSIVRRYVILRSGTKIPILSVKWLGGDAAEAQLEWAHGLPLLVVASEPVSTEWTDAVAYGLPGKTNFLVVVYGKVRWNRVHSRHFPQSRWVEAYQPYMAGMSGGPVMVNGKVVGIISRVRFPGTSLASPCDPNSLRDIAAALAPPAADAGAGSRR